jgi:hypothetical protein
MEVWKKIEGFDYDYRVSNYGNVICKNPIQLKNANRNLGSKDLKGYLRVCLVANKKPKTIKIHRLVAKYFIDNYSELLTVNHKDFNKENNSVENLEMMTFSENTGHYIQNIIKNKSYSKHIGISFHLGINKWTARITVNDKRHSLGVFETEKEALDCYNNFCLNPSSNNLKIGKGKSNLGRSKYSEEQNLYAFELAKKIGVRKAGKETGMGSTRISMLRRKYNTFIKN